MTQDYWSNKNRWWDWELARRIGTHQTNHEATYNTRSHHSKLDPKKGRELEPQALQLPTLLQQMSAGCILTCCPSVYLSVCRREVIAELTSTNFKELATKGFYRTVLSFYHDFQLSSNALRTASTTDHFLHWMTPQGSIFASLQLLLIQPAHDDYQTQHWSAELVRYSSVNSPSFYHWQKY